MEEAGCKLVRIARMEDICHPPVCYCIPRVERALDDLHIVYEGWAMLSVVAATLELPSKIAPHWGVEIGMPSLLQKVKGSRSFKNLCLLCGGS